MLTCTEEKQKATGLLREILGSLLDNNPDSIFGCTCFKGNPRKNMYNDPTISGESFRV